MNYAIIGAGKVGTALARHFARQGIAVGVANSRGVDSLATLAAELGDKIRPLSLAEAVQAHVVILAIPFRAHSQVARASTNWNGRIVVDAMNTYGISPSELEGRASSAIVASAFAGARVVKTLNQLPARLLAQDPGEHGGRRVMFVSGDDEASRAHVAKLLDDLGFAPITLGGLAEGSVLTGMGGPLLLQNLVKLPG